MENQEKLSQDPKKPQLNPHKKEKKAKKLLSEDYESVVNSIQELIFIVDTSGRIIGFNDKFARSIPSCIRKHALGEDFDFILKKHWGESDLQKSCKKAIDDILIRGKFHKESDFLKSSAPNFFFVKGRHGEDEGLFKVRAFPSFGKDGIIRRVVCVVNDVTKLRIADDHLRKVTELNEKILKNIPVGVATIDKNGIVNYNNPHIKNLVGDKQGKSIFEMDFIKEHRIVEDFKKLIRGNGRNFSKEECKYFNKKIKKNVFLDLRMVPFKKETGKIEGAIVIVDDVTKDVEFRMRIEKFNQELENKIIERTKQLEEAINLKTRFIADASHELRTPLTIMRGNLDLILRGSIDEESKAMVKTVEEQVDHMAKMLVDLTMLAKGDRDVSGLNLIRFNFAALIEGIVKSFYPVSVQNNIKLEFKKEQSTGNFLINGDIDKLERMATNFISNAIKYGKEGGWIKIKICEEKKDIILIFEDNGVGISQRDLPYIFERFYRTDIARHKNDGEGGTGLGLAICKWVVEAHGGSIEVKSSLNKGTKFTVVIPKK